MAKLRVALFVEGSTDETTRAGEAPLRQMWQMLATAVGAPRFSQIVGINKKHLLALDPSNPKMSGQEEPLDLLMERRRVGDPFDAALVVWDLVPRWNPEARLCRHAEVLDLYRFLSASTVLPNVFAEKARHRYETLESGAPLLPYLQMGSIVAICMEPDFEAIFAKLDTLILEALGLEKRPKDWPNFKRATRYDQVLAACIDSARPRPDRIRHLPRKWESAKNTWAQYFAEQGLADPVARIKLLASPPLHRLRRIAESSLV